MKRRMQMKYIVDLEIDANVSVEVEADSPEDAMEKAHYRDADTGDITVSGFRALGCTDANGTYTEGHYE